MVSTMNFTQRVLRTIEESDLAISTPDLIAIHQDDVRNVRQRVWGALEILLRNGLVEKEYRETRVECPDGRSFRRRVAFWRAA